MILNNGSQVVCAAMTDRFHSAKGQQFSMYTIEMTLRGTPMSLSVQRKELEDAQTLYQEILQALQTSTPRLLELTCDREPDKKLGVLSGEISAVQLSDKTGGSAVGRAAGFWADQEP